MPTYRVFATCDIGTEALDRLRQGNYQLEVYDKIEPPPKRLILEKVASGIDALITTLRDEIDEEVLRAGRDTLQVVAQDAVGFDNIDREAANLYGIPFTHTPDVLTETTAEFAFFMMGCVSRKLYPSERLVRQSRWETWHPYHPLLGDEVNGKTVAIIGLGRIGKAFAVHCTGLDVEIICCARNKQDPEFTTKIQKILNLKNDLGLSTQPRRIHYVTFEEALERADFLSLHVPLTRETHHLIDRRALRLMKSTAYLVNTSRGAVVDEEALVEALREDRIAGAALDVFEKEPLPQDSPLRDPSLEDRLRLFHHFASGGRRTRLSPDPELGMAGRTVEGLIQVLERKPNQKLKELPYVVNKEAFED
ncbi:MAG: D-glycerate dehydrogenase [Acidobacteriota bacterium]